MGSFGKIQSAYLESLIWGISLILLYFFNDAAGGPSFCLFKWMGFAHCPGCGIGHAIHDAMHFQFLKSFREHPLGIPATFVLICQMLKPFFTYKPQIGLYEPTTITHDASGIATR
jgi:hypothetical protein